MPAKVSVLRLLVLACMSTCKEGQAGGQRCALRLRSPKLRESLNPSKPNAFAASRTLGLRVLISSITVVQLRGEPKSPFAKTMRCVGPLLVLLLPRMLALALVLMLALVLVLA
jgi:hypothetical protein